MTANRNFRGTSYRLCGDPQRKPPVVLLHGVGLDQSIWRIPVKLLGRRFSVLTYDFLGHGGSHNPAGARRIGDYVDQLVELTGHLGLPRFALAGFSMGALVALAFAATQPRRLTHLALLHSVYRRSEAQREAVRERCRITRERGPLVTVEAAIERWFSAGYRRSHAEVMDEIRGIFARHTDDGYLKAYRLFADAEAQMCAYPPARVTCPALVLTGSDDTGSVPRMSRELCRDLPNARLIINRGHRHMAPVEHAEVVTGQLMAFLTAEHGGG